MNLETVQPLIVLLLVLSLTSIVLAVFSLRRRNPVDLTPLRQNFEAIEKSYERIDQSIKSQFSDYRADLSRELKQSRDELASTVSKFGKTLNEQLESFRKENLETREHIHGQMRASSEQATKSLADFREANEKKIGELESKIESKLKELQAGNEKKLEEMRVTVDEKLQGTLEKRLGESFKQVSERLEQVHAGLGEMKTLATGVGDLKKVLSNVKVRGTWGEAQLGSILELYFSPEQYEQNVAVKKGSADRVEFALKLPGKDSDGTLPVYLPIDAKFPQEDYANLLQAQEQANPELVEKYSKALEMRIKSEARDIHDKYINPPATTDFAIMFLPTESLYAELLRRPGIAEQLICDYHVIVTGPSTCSALLSSLQVGFRTLAVEKRSAEIWKLLGAVKSEFGKFGDLLDKTHKKLLETSNVIENASRKSRTIERKLSKVQDLPDQETEELLTGEENELSDSERAE